MKEPDFYYDLETGPLDRREKPRIAIIGPSIGSSLAYDYQQMLATSLPSHNIIVLGNEREEKTFMQILEEHEEIHKLDSYFKQEPITFKLEAMPSLYEKDYGESINYMRLETNPYGFPKNRNKPFSHNLSKEEIQKRRKKNKQARKQRNRK